MAGGDRPGTPVFGANRVLTILRAGGWKTPGQTFGLSANASLANFSPSPASEFPTFHLNRPTTVNNSPTLPEDDSKKLLGLQMWRAGAAILVVLYHLATASEHRFSKEAGKSNWLSVFEAIGIGGVDLFFVVSGVVMAATCYGRLGDRSAILPFLKRRVSRIYPFYWVCTATVLALYWLSPGLASRSKADWGEIVQSLVLWPQDVFPVVGVGWTLTYEMFFYLVFALLLGLPPRLFLGALAIWGTVTLALFPLFDDPAIRGIRANLALPLYASPLVLEFIAGCCIGWVFRRGSMPLAKLCLGVGAVWFVAVGGYIGSKYFDEAAYGVVRLAVFGIPSALMLYGTVGLELQGQLRVAPLLVYLGDSSYSLYLTHVYVIGIFSAVYVRLAPFHHGLGKLLLTIICLVTCGAVAAISYRWIERPLSARFRRLLSAVKRERGKAQVVKPSSIARSSQGL